MTTSLPEGQSSSRPPLFSGTNYGYWKARMKIFIQSIDFQLWKVIMKGPYIPTINVDGVDIPKPEEDWDDQEMKKGELNAKAMNLLYCALDPNEFNQISICNSAKEIWDRLEVTHKGTNQVKESKINLLMHDYELFKMKPTETISEMFTHFTDIINGLKNLDKIYSNRELVQKVLRSLSEKWDSKITVIQEAKDMNTLSLEELLGSLMIHELNVKRRSEDDGNKKKKTIALPTVTDKKAVEDDSSSSEENMDDEDMALVIRRFKRFMFKGKSRFRRKHFAKEEQSREREGKGQRSAVHLLRM